MKAIEVDSFSELHQKHTPPVSLNTTGRQSLEDRRHLQPTEYGWKATQARSKLGEGLGDWLNTLIPRPHCISFFEDFCRPFHSRGIRLLARQHYFKVLKQ